MTRSGSFSAGWQADPGNWVVKAARRPNRRGGGHPDPARFGCLGECLDRAIGPRATSRLLLSTVRPAGPAPGGPSHPACTDGQTLIKGSRHVFHPHTALPASPARAGHAYRRTGDRRPPLGCPVPAHRRRLPLSRPGSRYFGQGIRMWRQATIATASVRVDPRTRPHSGCWRPHTSPTNCQAMAGSGHCCAVG